MGKSHVRQGRRLPLELLLAASRMPNAECRRCRSRSRCRQPPAASRQPPLACATVRPRPMLLHDYVTNSWLPGVLLWTALNACVHFLAAINGRLYRAGARNQFEWEGSPELQSLDPAAAVRLRWYRVNAAITMVGIAGLLAVVWWGAREFTFGKSLYLAVLGSCVLPECTACLRYLNNYLIFRSALDGHSIAGKVTFAEAFVRRSAATGLLSFAGLYLLVGLVIQHWFCLGGAMGCLLAAYREHERAQRIDQV